MYTEGRGKAAALEYPAGAKGFGMKRFSPVVIAVLAVVVLFPAAEVWAQKATLAATPPMGWNSWNLFACKVSDAVVRAAADAMATNGMKDAGYSYINIDDCWQGQRDAAGNIQGNERFPDMKALADYVHSKGLKIGIYSSPGPKTCAGYEGSYQHEEQDARTYAAWGFDYLKYDWCSADKVYKNSDMPAVYKKMGDALKATGRPIVFSLCQYGVDAVWTWGAQSGGNLWRTSRDIDAQLQQHRRPGIRARTPASTLRRARPLERSLTCSKSGNGTTHARREPAAHEPVGAAGGAAARPGTDLRQHRKPEILSISHQPRDRSPLDQDPLGVEGHRSWQGALKTYSRA